jgi:aerobic carbon-monoxide dehydrogenase large subunit
VPFDSISYVARDAACIAAGGGSQGSGQAVAEHSYYDPESGQLRGRELYGSCAAALRLKTALGEVPSPSNRLDVRSGREGGTLARAAVINAIVEALTELGVRRIEMLPIPEWVSRAIQAARPTRSVGDQRW